ncbi:hypothetical protein NPS01_25610 [Nocardioides psychrotolerans]|uniref:Kelch motif-containing protein n=1 Tax=Nocardioides psychrotolerans TaxID=1005945 RepID=A0A1I3LRD2_9ACTN|nr:kelch repeat-containing protein [Nocardioides psychrotolerans]GEP38898.1 hypothetical protein NPS01_25610 [Nocardioides psychrotolerans]SFI87329.1 Kelch motif-containing protein [Nocardioides psychrotolerans]
MGAWQQIAPLPVAVATGAGLFHDGKVYVFGGANNSGLTSSTFIYTPETNTWASGAPVPAALFGYAFSVGTKIHFLGFSTTSGAVKHHYRYDPATNTWENRATPPTFRGQPLGFQDAAGRIYLAMGREGLGGSSGYSPSYIVERYTPGSNTWETLTPAPYSDEQYSITGVMGDDGKLYCGHQTFASRLYVYDPATGVWSLTPETASLPDWGSGAYNQPVSRLASGTILALPGNHGGERRKRVDGYTPGASAWALGVIPDYPGAVLDYPAVATDPSGFVYLIGGEDNYGGGSSSAQAYVYLENRTPNAPVLTTMVGGALISTASPNRAAHTFNDPDTGDSQSKFELRHRIVGTVTWTTVVVNSPNPFYDFPPGTFTPGNYERQVRTWDAGGLVGPWCASGFFTAANPPAGPSITYPINGQSVEQTETLVWSTAEQDAYQVRRVGNTAGAPNTAVIYYDTGEVVAPLPRSIPLTFETNNRPEHLQVRVKFAGLWSVWISVMVNVDYTEPMVPSFVIYPDPDTASLQIMLTNPAPTGGAPVTVYNDVYVTEGGVEERKATELPTNEGWRYWTPVSGRDYSTAIRVVAVAANGTTASTP